MSKFPKWNLRVSHVSICFFVWSLFQLSIHILFYEDAFPTIYLLLFVWVNILGGQHPAWSQGNEFEVRSTWSSPGHGSSSNGRWWCCHGSSSNGGGGGEEKIWCQEIEVLGNFTPFPVDVRNVYIYINIFIYILQLMFSNRKKPCIYMGIYIY